MGARVVVVGVAGRGGLRWWRGTRAVDDWHVSTSYKGQPNETLHIHAKPSVRRLQQPATSGNERISIDVQHIPFGSAGKRCRVCIQLVVVRCVLLAETAVGRPKKNS